MRDSAISVLFKGRNAVRLLEGLGVTLSLSAVSVLLSILTGLILGFLMMRKNPAIRLLCRIWLEAIRIVPQLVLLFLVYFGAAKAFGSPAKPQRSSCSPSGAAVKWAIWCAAH